MKLFLVFSFVVLASLSYGQSAEPSIFIGPAITSYSGDMGNFDNIGAGLQAGLQFRKKRRLNGAVNLGFGQISDDDPSISNNGRLNALTPNSYFKTTFYFANYDLHYNFINNGKYIVYLSQGLGFMGFTVQDENGQSLSEQTDTRVEGENYRNSSLILPTSIGALFQLADHVGVGCQLSLMNTNTDYLDNISQLGSQGNDNILAVRFSAYFSFSSKNKN